MLTWAVAAPVALLVILAVTFLALLRWMMVEADWVTHTDRVLSVSQRAERLVVDMETGVRGYLITGHAEFLAPYYRAASEVDGAFATLNALVADNPSQAKAAAELTRRYRLWQAVAVPMSAGGVVTTHQQLDAKRRMDALRDGFARFTAVEEQLRARRTAKVGRTLATVIALTAIIALTLGIVVGMTSRHALNEVAREYGQLLAEAQAANIAKDEFLTTLSHELRTPLTAILGWSRLMQLHPPDPENLKLALETIERSARSQAALIDDILDVSRIITGKMTLELRDVDLSATVRGVVDALAPTAAAKNIAIVVEAEPSVPLRADPTRLQQIIVNLLSNAVKFSARGSSIRVVVQHRGDEAVVKVIDAGRGIDPAFLPYVFERFRQADSTSTREYGGLGIGLSVVKLLAEMHGGSVRAESAGFGKGSTFTVVLPASPHAADGVVRHAAAADGALRDREILVVDDDEGARLVIAAMLQSAGAKVTSAGSVPAAMIELLRRPFAAIVTDIAMPGEDGYALLRRVGADGNPNQTTPVIAVTALSIDSVAGAFAAVVQKPIDPLDLTRTVAALVAEPR